MRRLVLYPLVIVVVVYAVLVVMALRSDGMIFLPPPSSYTDSDLGYLGSETATAEQRVDSTALRSAHHDNADATVDASSAHHDNAFRVFHLHSGSGADAATITAVYLANPEARFTLLMSHGNAEDIGENRDLYDEYRRRGFAVFAYDYRGYGTSTGTPTERTSYLDEHAAWDYLTNALHVAPSRIIVHGTSVGCGPAVELAALLSSRPIDAGVGNASANGRTLSSGEKLNAGRPAALILRSPFRSAFTVLTHIPILPWDKFPNARRIRSVRMPVLVVHGMRDEVIPFAHGEAIFRAAPPEGDQDAPLTRDGGKQHLWIPGAGHNDIFAVAPRLYFDRVEAFARQLP